MKSGKKSGWSSGSRANMYLPLVSSKTPHLFFSILTLRRVTDTTPDFLSLSLSLSLSIYPYYSTTTHHPSSSFWFTSATNKAPIIPPTQHTTRLKNETLGFCFESQLREPRLLFLDVLNCGLLQDQPENLLLDSQGNLKISDFGHSALPAEVRFEYVVIVSSIRIIIINLCVCRVSVSFEQPVELPTMLHQSNWKAILWGHQCSLTPLDLLQQKWLGSRCLIDAENGMASWSLNKEFKNWFTFWMVRWVSLLMMLRRTACASSYHQNQPLINLHVPLRVTIEAMAKAFGVTVDFIDLGKQGAVTIHCTREASLQDQQSSRCFGNQPPRCKECSLSNLSIVILQE
ncbi:unnamed protein product [Lactuca saligna]|uniref:Non-specific serine/threonine protein kinase n=1 Tax=Lactuca saligna TaxID=75948 RepID=A0AA35V6I1_LACSI|nr:unnamed protein product [Lactuca saligna]